MAARFWVDGTGTWDASTTTHWASSSNGAGGQSVPGASDTVTFDAASDGGTVTVGAGYNPTIQSLTMGAFTGTLDFSANDNNVTLTASAGFSGTGAGTRTLNLGDGTFTISASAGAWNFGTVTGLTFNANGSTIQFTNTTAANHRSFSGGGLTYNNVIVVATSGGGGITITGSNTFASLTATGPASVIFAQSATQTITTLTLDGSAFDSAIDVRSSSPGTQATVSVAAGTPTLDWLSIKNIIWTGGATFEATNSFDLKDNTGITITGPSGSGAPGHANMTGGL